MIRLKTRLLSFFQFSGALAFHFFNQSQSSEAVNIAKLYLVIGLTHEKPVRWEARKNLNDLGLR